MKQRLHTLILASKRRLIGTRFGGGWGLVLAAYWAILFIAGASATGFLKHFVVLWLSLQICLLINWKAYFKGRHNPQGWLLFIMLVIIGGSLSPLRLYEMMGHWMSEPLVFIIEDEQEARNIFYAAIIQPLIMIISLVWYAMWLQDGEAINEAD